MLLGYLNLLNSKKFILGSQSKSRRALLQSQKLIFDRVPSTFEEDLDKKSFPNAKQYNIATCKGKVDELLIRFDNQNREWDILLCCDTIAQLDGQIIEKPMNQNHCIEMISSLIGKWHKVYTTHFLVFNTKQRFIYNWVSQAQLKVGRISQQSILEYSKLPEGYLHSGGYEIEGVSGSIIQQIRGNISCIQGIDTHQLAINLIKGIKQSGWI